MNLQQIREIARGVDRVNETDGVFDFYRFAVGRADAYLAQNLCRAIMTD